MATFHFRQTQHKEVQTRGEEMFQEYLKQYKAEKAEVRQATQERIARKKKPATKRVCNDSKKTHFKRLLESGKCLKEASLAAGITQRTGHRWFDEGMIDNL
jgi:hypothetical protein